MFGLHLYLHWVARVWFFKDICQIHFVWYEKSWCGSEVFGGNDKSIKPVSLGFINVQCAVKLIKLSFFSAILACILLVIEIYASLRKTNNTILERKGHQGDGFPIAICIKDRLNDTLWYSEWWKVATHYNLSMPVIYYGQYAHCSFWNNGNTPE